MNHAPSASLPPWAERPMDLFDDLFDDGPSSIVRDEDIVEDSPDQNDRFEESVRIAEAKILLNAGSNSDVTLCQLPLKPEEHFESLHGVIVTDRRRSSFNFALTVGQTLSRYIPIQNIMEGLPSLFEQLFQIEDILVLTGNSEDGLFRVTGLHCTGINRITGHRFKRISDTTVQSVLNRLIYCAYPDSLHQPYRATVLPAGESELRFLFSVIRDSLPRHQQDWADYSFSLLKSASREEKGHILRALSYVLNINWRPRPIAVAPQEEIRALLDQEFFGMESVKTRICEIAAQIRRCGKLPRWGILLNGPAGVGKTSMAKAIAQVLNLPLVSIELSTASDGDAISGTSRIYSNAHPGAVLESIWSQAQGDSNCVFLLNELDKAAAESTNHINPSNALLTLVDKLSGFTDNYLETGISTDCMFFVATCNDIDKISKPLQDRFLRIDIEGYSPREKQQIFRQYTFPRALAAANVSPEELTLTDEFIQILCRSYATTPGIRDLEQCAERIIGDFLLRAEQDRITEKTYTPDDLIPLFGPTNVLQRTLQHGPGLAWAPIVSGEQATICLVQAKQRPGTGQLTLVGFPNRFYKDCARMAFEHAKSSFDLSKTDIILCLPRIAPPTTDNFIGCAIYMSIASALTGKSLPPTALFLGSCDLHGNVFWPESTLAPVMQLLQRHNIKTLYGPIGIGSLLPSSSDVTTIESYTADLLFNLF